MQLANMLIELLLQPLIIIYQVIQLTGLAKAATRTNTLPDARGNCALLALVTVQFQTKITQASTR